MSLKIKTYPELVTDMLAAIGEKTGLTNFNVGSVVRTTTEVFAEVVAELYAFGAGMRKQGFLDTATAHSQPPPSPSPPPPSPTTSMVTVSSPEFPRSSVTVRVTACEPAAVGVHSTTSPSSVPSGVDQAQASRVPVVPKEWLPSRVTALPRGNERSCPASATGSWAASGGMTMMSKSTSVDRTR